MSEKEKTNGGVRADVATRFQPGQSGNPGGRPQTKAISDAFKLYFSNYQKFCRTTPAKLKKFVEAQVKAACAGNAAAAGEIMDRVEGKVVATNVNIAASVTDEIMDEVRKAFSINDTGNKHVM